MTISTNAMRNEYTASAGQTIFNYTFKIYAATDLNVYITPTGQDADDSTDLTTSYTVAGVGLDAGGSITLNSGATLDDLVTIVGNIPDSRTTDYQNNGDFLPDVVNDDFDRVVSLVKQVEDMSNRALLLENSQQGSKPFSLPAPEAGAYLIWNDTEDGVDNGTAANLLQADPGGEVVINEAGLDCDFRVESALNEHAFFLEGSSGNIGFDYDALDPWSASYKALQIKEVGNLSATDTTLNLSQNAYYGSDWTYQTANLATLYRQGLGGHLFYYAPFGSAEGTITWVSALLMTATDTVFNEDGEEIDFRIESGLDEYAFYINGSTGNIGLDFDGTDAWGESYKALQILATGNLSATNTTLNLSQNAFRGTGWTYQTANLATLYQQTVGEHIFYSAITGLAGAAVTWVENLFMTASQTVFNEGGVDHDFRVESSLNANAFFLEGSSSYTGIGTGSPLTHMHVYLGSAGGGFSPPADGITIENNGVSSLMLLTPDANAGYIYWGSPTNDNNASIRYGHDEQRMYLSVDNVGDSISLVIDQDETFVVTGTEIALNYDGLDVDTIISSSIEQYALILEGSSSNIGLNNGAIEAWLSTLTAMQIGDNSSIAATTAAAGVGSLYLTTNTYLGSGGWVYQEVNNPATYYRQNNGIHSFYYAEADTGTPFFYNLLAMSGSDTIFNETGADVNFRIESDINTHAFFLEGSTGHIGLNRSTISPWTTAKTSFQVGGTGAIACDTAETTSRTLHLTQNAYNDGGWKYIVSDRAHEYYQAAGYHLFRSAVSGTAGAALAWQNLMYLRDDGCVFNEDGLDIDLRVESDTNPNALFLEASSSNLGINTSDFGGASPGVGVLAIANGTAPSASPTGGGVLYSVAGALTWYGSSGTITTIAPA